MNSHFPIPKININSLDNFKFILRKYNYTQDYLLKVGVNPFVWAQTDLPIFAYRFPPTSPFGILFHLFFLGRKIKLKLLERLLSKQDIKDLFLMNILRKVNNAVLESAVFLIPYKTYYFACDFILHMDRRSGYKSLELLNSVYPARLDSITLSESSIKKTVDSVLDLGCGSGILSIIASGHSKHVTGIDINPRSINFSRFNALLNDIDNCQFICGDLYSPIKNGKFDLILSNPPYEIAIKKSSLYQDGGEYGFKVLEKIIQGIPAHLKKGGFCHIVSKIADFSNLSREKLIRKWILNSSLYVFYLELYTMNIYQLAYEICSDYFSNNNAEMNFRNYTRKIGQILNYLEEIKLRSMSTGIFTIKHDSGFKYA